VVAGSPIYGIQPNETNRFDAINGVNSGTLDGIIMTSQTGGCGHNIPGAQVTIFMGSLYRPSEEGQVTGLPFIMLC